jgi:hypothetical protein
MFLCLKNYHFILLNFCNSHINSLNFNILLHIVNLLDTLLDNFEFGLKYFNLLIKLINWLEWLNKYTLNLTDLPKSIIHRIYIKDTLSKIHFRKNKILLKVKHYFLKYSGLIFFLLKQNINLNTLYLLKNPITLELNPNIMLYYSQIYFKIKYCLDLKAFIDFFEFL